MLLARHRARGRDGHQRGDVSKLIDYHDYMEHVSLLLALFCAAQAPELVSRDQHNRVLPLYFSRALRSTTTRPPSCWPCGRRCSS